MKLQTQKLLAHIVGEYPLLAVTTDYTATIANGTATGFVFNLYKTIDAGYTATFQKQMMVQTIQ